MTQTRPAIADLDRQPPLGDRQSRTPSTPRTPSNNHGHGSSSNPLAIGTNVLGHALGIVRPTGMAPECQLHCRIQEGSTGWPSGVGMRRDPAIGDNRGRCRSRRSSSAGGSEAVVLRDGLEAHSVVDGFIHRVPLNVTHVDRITERTLCVGRRRASCRIPVGSRSHVLVAVCVPESAFGTVRK